VGTVPGAAPGGRRSASLLISVCKSHSAARPHHCLKKVGAYGPEASTACQSPQAPGYPRLAAHRLFFPPMLANALTRSTISPHHPPCLSSPACHWVRHWGRTASDGSREAPADGGLRNECAPGEGGGSPAEEHRGWVVVDNGRWSGEGGGCVGVTIEAALRLLAGELRGLAERSAPGVAAVTPPFTPPAFGFHVLSTSYA
jgi:hypothetical protein